MIPTMDKVPWDAMKAGVAVVAAQQATAPVFGWDGWFIAFFGVGFTTIGMSLIGSAFSFAFGSRTKNKPLMFFQFLAAAGIGAAAVTGIPELLHKAPVVASARPVVGFFYALFARWFMPVLIDVIPMLARRWLNIPEKIQ